MAGAAEDLIPKDIGSEAVKAWKKRKAAQMLNTTISNVNESVGMDSGQFFQRIARGG